MSGGKKSVQFDSKEVTTTDRVAGFLRQLADRVESGQVVLRQGEGEAEVEVELPDSVVLEVSLDRKEKGPKGTKRSLEVEIEWYEEGRGRGPVRVG